MYLSTNSKYRIKDIVHTIPKNVTFESPIKMTDKMMLDKVYDGLKYTINFFNENDIDYIGISGTLIGAVRHMGIIPWDNDFDLLVFKNGFDKLDSLIDSFNNHRIKMLKMSPGYRVFVDTIFIGDIFVYGLNHESKYVKSYPYINGKPNYLIHKIYFPWIKYDLADLFPTSEMQFEDFKINVPHNIKKVLKVNYPKSKLDICKSYDQSTHSLLSYDQFKYLGKLELLSLKIPIIGYLLCYLVHLIINMYIKDMWVHF